MIQRKLFRSFMLAMICVVFLFNLLHAATIEVGFGKMYTTIQSAINVASCGDIVLVNAGTYAGFSTTQNCHSDAYLTVQANGGDTVNINSETTINHTYHKMIGFNIHPSNGGCVTIEKDTSKDGSYFEFRNNFCCPGGNNNTGVMYPWHNGVYGASYTIIYGNKFGPCEYDGHSSSIRLRGSNQIISHNIFDYFGGGDQIYLLARNSIISDNEFKNNNHMVSNGEHPDCIQTQWSADEENYNNIIERNYFHHNMGQQIYTQTTGTDEHDIIVRNNIFAICGAKGVQTSGTNWKIYNNTFFLCSKNTGHPVGLRNDSSGSEVYNNLFIGNGNHPASSIEGWFGDDSLSVLHSNNYVAGKGPSFSPKNINYTAGNTVTLSTEAGIVNGGAPKFVNAPIDWVLTNTNGDIYDGDSKHFEVSTVDSANFNVGEFVEYCPYATGCDGVARQITGKSGNLITFSPAISSYSNPNCNGNIGTNQCAIFIVLWGTNNSNYTLDLRAVAGSPAIDKGTSIPGFANDYNNVSRPKGVAWDIGAFELEDVTPPSKINTLKVK